MVEGGFAPGVTRWNLKDRVAASGSNRIGLDLCWSRLAPLSCWPRLPSETNVACNAEDNSMIYSSCGQLSTALKTVLGTLTLFIPIERTEFIDVSIRLAANNRQSIGKGRGPVRCRGGALSPKRPTAAFHGCSKPRRLG